MRSLAVVVTSCLLLASAAVPAAAVTAQEIERDVMCVTCGVPLQVAESPAADAQRREINRLVDAGLTKEQIEDRLVAIYGERVLAVPRDTGLSLTAIALPAGLVAATAIVLILAARRWRSGAGAADDAASEAPETDLDDAAAARVAADLARYER
ncbi:MAG: cytochrome c-type biogenesis protein CcmH [Baekduia sp.]